jgi:putative ABC transport system substrate-binding protein
MIVAIGAVGAIAARKATSTIPIVFAIVLDPVEVGLVASVDRPGGNVTGVTNYDPDLALAQLSLLCEVVQGLDRVAVLSDADIPRPHGWNPLERSCDDAAAKLGIAVEWMRTRGPAPDRREMLREAVQRGCKAVLVLEVPVNIGDFTTIAMQANDHGLPSVFPGGWQHDGLLSYGTSLLQTIPALPHLVDLIRAGTPPGEVPIQKVCRHRLRVNLATAQLIGIEVPVPIISSADEVVR